MVFLFGKQKQFLLIQIEFELHFIFFGVKTRAIYERKERYGPLVVSGGGVN